MCGGRDQQIRSMDPQRLEPELSYLSTFNAYYMESSALVSILSEDCWLLRAHSGLFQLIPCQIETP